MSFYFYFKKSNGNGLIKAKEVFGLNYVKRRGYGKKMCVCFFEETYSRLGALSGFLLLSLYNLLHANGERFRT
jgi:hypothetical protein